mmetsp:Transcript_10046/g.14727  ORF Transcript_10046/g.14727 Transcript_10046/m.14727 type:complete len:118 (-) Transcript_10046:36-389(-)
MKDRINGILIASNEFVQHLDSGDQENDQADAEAGHRGKGQAVKLAFCTLIPLQQICVMLVLGTCVLIVVRGRFCMLLGGRHKTDLKCPMQTRSSTYHVYLLRVYYHPTTLMSLLVQA